MKRFHVHIHVDDLAKNLAFYAKMFGTPPTRVESDYAKWMLEDPAVNFAISTRGNGHLGLDHLGIQAQDEADLAELKAQAQAADLSLIDEGATTCCYARSDKQWITDPQGLPWEHFHTLGSIPTFRGLPDLGTGCPASTAAPSSPCCTPSPRAQCSSAPIKSVGSGCC